MSPNAAGGSREASAITSSAPRSTQGRRVAVSRREDALDTVVALRKKIT
jgi:hypothetical protein